MPHTSRTNKSAIEELARQDDFGHPITHDLTTLQESQGYQRTTPERRRVYRNGSRLFLMYDDGFIDNETSTYVDDIDAGTKLKPDPGDTMMLQSTDRAAYAIGYNLIPTFAFQINGGIERDDAVAIGYGDPDLDNFDVGTETYDAGSTADGWFGIMTGERGIGEVLFIEVRDGAIQDRSAEEWVRSADILKRLEVWTSWYGVGPGTLYETYTAVTEKPTPDRTHPQRTDLVTSVAHDDGKGPLAGGNRLTFQVRQAAGSSGLELECGSFSMLVAGAYEKRFKSKGHLMTLANTNTTTGTYQVVGAVHVDRPRTTGQVESIEILDYPSTTSEVEVLVQAIDPSETDIVDGDFGRPSTHSRLNSAVSFVEDNTATGPDEGDAGTNIDGPTTTNTMTNPGGYQIGHAVLRAEKKNQQQSSVRTSRRLPTTDYALVLIDANEVGDYVINFQFAQNA